MSATIAWNDFLQTSGKWPASFRIPPACPPMPSAHVLPAFLADMAFQSCHQPTLLAIRSEYLMAAQPPPFFIGFIRPTPSERRTTLAPFEVQGTRISRIGCVPSLEQRERSGT